MGPSAQSSKDQGTALCRERPSEIVPADIHYADKQRCLTKTPACDRHLFLSMMDQVAEGSVCMPSCDLPCKAELEVQVKNVFLLSALNTRRIVLHGTFSCKSTTTELTTKLISTLPRVPPRVPPRVAPSLSKFHKKASYLRPQTHETLKFHNPKPETLERGVPAFLHLAASTKSHQVPPLEFLADRMVHPRPAKEASSVEKPMHTQHSILRKAY